MKLISAMAAKELKKLNERHEALLSMERKAAEFVAAIQEDIDGNGNITHSFKKQRICRI